MQETLLVHPITCPNFQTLSAKSRGRKAAVIKDNEDNSMTEEAVCFSVKAQLMYLTWRACSATSCINTQLDSSKLCPSHLPTIKAKGRQASKIYHSLRTVTHL